MKERFDAAPPPGGRILIVDDDPFVAGALGITLIGAGHEIVEVDSGEKALTHLATCVESGAELPDVVFLDIEMGMGIDGYETCRRMRAMEVARNLLVIFLSGHDELEDRLSAYDAGGDDFMAKPFDPDEVLRKAALSVRHHRQVQLQANEIASSFDTAMMAISSLDESGITLKFSRAAIGCRTQHALAKQTVSSMRSFGLDCHVQIRVPSETLTLTPRGAASPLEASVFEMMRTMGRLFSFKNRMIINYDSISLLIMNMPLEDEVLCGRIRDHAATMAETAELAIENIHLRIEESRRLAQASREAVEKLRGSFREMQVATRVELEGMASTIENMYVHLGLTDRQEFTISDTVRGAVERTLTLLEHSSQLDQDFANIVTELTKASEYTESQEDEALPTVELW